MVIAFNEEEGTFNASSFHNAPKSAPSPSDLAMSAMDRATMRLSSSVKTIDRRFRGAVVWEESAKVGPFRGNLICDELASANMCNPSMVVDVVRVSQVGGGKLQRNARMTLGIPGGFLLFRH